MNHVSVSPTDGNGPTQGQRETLTRVGIEPTTFGLDHRCSTDKVRREQAVGTEDFKVTDYVLYKRWPCSTYISVGRSNPKVVGSIHTLVRVFLCPCVGHFH